MAQAAATPGFEQDIRPLFRPLDIEHMAKGGVALDQYAYMSVPENAEKVYRSVAEKRMPPPDEGVTWSKEQVSLLRAWIDAGFQP